MDTKPAIVICAYNRPRPLQRLLDSVARAIYGDTKVDLIISIDKSEEHEVERIAEEFQWNFGRKRVVLHKTHLGLKQHILYSGSLAKEYGSVIVLEDDLMVSPHFYQYAVLAENYYRTDADVAGISLYNYQVSESSYFPFKAIDDGSDVYFMQIASSWGQLWTSGQWRGFEEWLADHPELIGDNVPSYLKKWGPDSWKKHFIHYLIETGKYFVFPTLSLSTNFEEPGTNTVSKNVFQVPLQLTKKEYRFRDLAASYSVYDASFELLPRCINDKNPTLSSFNYEVDLYGTKEILDNHFEYILTSKKAENPEISFGLSLSPLETNVLWNLRGNGIGLYKKSDNQFSQMGLSISNHLDNYQQRKEQGISVVIPVINLNVAELKTTLRSISDQRAADLCECLIVSHPFDEEKIQEMALTSLEGARVIITKANATDAELLAAGFRLATREIVTWILPGNLFSEKAFETVQLIFRSYPVLEWISGIDQNLGAEVDLKDSELRKYRLHRTDIYGSLLKSSLNANTQLHFFKKYCAIPFVDEHDSVHDLYFKLYNNHRCYVALFRFGNRLNRAYPSISNTDAKRLLIAYKHFREKPEGLFAKICYTMLSSPLLSRNLKYLLGIFIKNLPDVLRFDERHGVPRLSKY